MNRYTEEEKRIICEARAEGDLPKSISAKLSKAGYGRTPAQVACWLYNNKDNVPPPPQIPKYTQEIAEYARTKMERAHSKNQVAKEIKRVFGLSQKEETILKWMVEIVKEAKILAVGYPVKRLFFDIETSFYIGWFWRPSWKATIGPHQILQDKKIICIGYKWQYEDKVRMLVWDKDQDEKVMLRKFMKVLGKADEIIGHNGDKFDIKELRTRCIQEGILMFPKYRTLDTLLKARRYFSFPSNKLGEIAKFLKVPQEKQEVDYTLWTDVVIKKDKKALKKMCEYCTQDVIVLESIFEKMCPYIDHNTNHAVQRRLDKWHCPECTGDNVKLSHTDVTPMGTIKRHMKCLDCRKFFLVSNRTYLEWLGSQETGINEYK